MDKEEKFLNAEDTEQNIVYEQHNSMDSKKNSSKFVATPDAEKLILTGDQNIRLDQLSSKNIDNNHYHNNSVIEKLNSLRNLSLKRKREVIATIHTKTETIGNFDTNLHIPQCPCCNKQIPRPYNYKKVFHANDLFDFGIDLINFNSLLKMFYKYLKYFWGIFIFFSILSICVSPVDWIDRIKIFFKGPASEYFWIFDCFFSYPIEKIFILLILVCFGGLLVFMFLQILNKISLNMKKYRMNILENKVIEETLFSVFVKGLPKLTDKDDLKQHLEDEYKVVIRDVIMLNDYSVLESYKKKLEYFYETGDVTLAQLENLLNQMDHYSKNIERNSCAIIIFEQNEDRLLFFREFFNLKEILYMYFKRAFVYRGKRIYFEPVPSLQMIDWNYCKYSIEKTMSNTKIQYLISFAFSAFIYSFAFVAISLVSSLGSEENIWFALLRNIALIFLNIFLKFALTLLISSFRLSDNYLKEILKAYFIGCRTLNNTIFINLILFACQSKSNYSILFLIILQNLKLGLLSIYNSDYFFRFISYKMYYNKKLNSQETLNDILGANTFNFMTSWEGFKACFYLMVFSTVKSCTLGIFGLVFLIIHFYMINMFSAEVN